LSRDIDQYRADYLADYGFEQVLVEYRAELVIDQLLRVQPDVVLEVGCGNELLYQRYLAHAGPVSRWIIVEPERTFCAQARAAGLPGLVVVEGVIEEMGTAIDAALEGSPDLVVCSGVLNEVPSAQAVLASIRKTMDRESLLHINVPNARSLHRQLALAMGLIPDLTTPSDRNLLLQQHRVYDFDTLSEEVEQAGFSIRQSGGHFVKPFTHAQMETIAPMLGEEVIRGLFELGRSAPEMASEIFVNAGKV